MTREQAIKIIERVDICANAAETARDMAIAALKEPEIVRCKDCKHGIWDEDEQMWECILSVDLTGDPDTYSMFHEYNDGDHFCSYGERKANEEH